MPLHYTSNNFKTNFLITVKKLLGPGNKALAYFLIICLLIPHTFSDRHSNRSNSIEKRKYQGSAGSEPEPEASGCHNCRMMREELKQRNLMVIKEEILRRIGFQEAPNMTGKALPQVPEAFLAQIEEQNGGMLGDQPYGGAGVTVTEEEEDYFTKTEKILTFAQTYPRLRHRGRDIIHFTFSDSITKYQVSNATLSIYIKGTERRQPQDVIIEVFKIEKATDHAEPTSFHRVLGKKMRQPIGKGEWVQLDFSETVSEWFKAPKDNHGFVVNATVNGKKVVVTELSVDKGKKMPYVEISTVQSKRRVRRNIGLNCDDHSREPICCRYPLEVDFELLGLDFIIAPKRYNAYMCAGECSYVTLQKYAHTHLKQIAMPGGLPPCCTPRKVGSISMLYYDDELNVLLGSLPGMVVERCGCL
ncbi:unnamed protein product [Phaedon cochleariae]|uniref:TGF-beta family profile domain-containing protein n=1 Tax=Phaedon cochleariae TaxID=80249 RepID=A0A9P0DEX6_PHACE|nr:unnamed protein product [Phaedon cochleariae]